MLPTGIPTLRSHRAGHAFDFVDGLPIRKRLRASTTLVPDAQAELPRVEADKIHPPGKTACGGRLIFETPSEACLSQTESPLLRLAQLTKATLLQAAEQESSPAVIKAIKCVSEQCVEAISAATQELPGDVDVAAVEQAAVERVLQHQQRLQHTQEQLRQQEAQIQSLSDDLTSLEQLTQSAGQQLSADAGAIGKTADQKSRSEVQVRADRNPH